ncbi:hypothetical protein SAMN05216312_102221 [Cohnella sp. OV330]|uniref:hypothetical protein n=1 Tax=Cohnella sp. OV330 TaxID=1855288 RepID=UPI0008E671BA|nr:hypothetical protein [Cohnella sp. OV330]SFA91648.1 hypothetical protein SAMN05216312_102221 [Cohnella sp. OV330]
MSIISDWHVRHDGVEYPANKPFSLSPEAEEKLVQDGAALKYEADLGQAELDEGSGVGGAADEGGKRKDNPIVSDLLTLEAFEKLKAPEQNELLKSVGIEPASREPERILQYTTWYAEKAQENGTANV